MKPIDNRSYFLNAFTSIFLEQYLVTSDYIIMRFCYTSSKWSNDILEDYEIFL